VPPASWGDIFLTKREPMTIRTFPTGKRFYACTPAQATYFIGYFRRDYHDAIKTVSCIEFKRQGVIQESMAQTGVAPYNGSSSMVPTNAQKNIVRSMVRTTNDDYPIFKLVAGNISFLFEQMHEGTNATIRHKQCFYQSIRRFTSIEDMPAYNGMLIQFIPDRCGFLLHDTPYEGPIIKSPEMFSKVNKMITERIMQLKGEVQLMGLIMDANTIKTPSGFHYPNSETQGDKMMELVPQLIDGTISEEDSTVLAICFKQYESFYENRERLLRQTKNNYKWYPGSKINVYYQYGAFDLPDDYEDWFDG